MVLTSDGASAGPRRSVTVLGATGSVGESTLDLIGRDPGRFRVEALTAHGNAGKLADLALRHRPAFVALGRPEGAEELRGRLAGTGIEIGIGAAAVTEAAARPAELVMAGIVGVAGLRPTLAAVERGALVAFANKECLVSAGPLMLAAVERHGARLLPVDSEHNAIFQVLDADNRAAVSRLLLTASGGPFWRADAATMARATPADAVAHPIWSMGAKISVDSATMMNKGLEIIEAAYLFGMPEARVEVLVHPQSVVHSLVEYVDGSVLAQLGTPDMRTPIAHALAWPGRMPTPSARLRLDEIGRLEFYAPDHERFPALALARAALVAGGSAPAVLNAANEVAVAAFLDRRLGFAEIVGVAEAVLDRHAVEAVESLEQVFAVDATARRIAGEEIARRAG